MGSDRGQAGVRIFARGIVVHTSEHINISLYYSIKYCVNELETGFGCRIQDFHKMEGGDRDFAHTVQRSHVGDENLGLKIGGRGRAGPPRSAPGFSSFISFCMCICSDSSVYVSHSDHRVCQIQLKSKQPARVADFLTLQHGYECQYLPYDKSEALCMCIICMTWILWMCTYLGVLFIRGDK